MTAPPPPPPRPLRHHACDASATGSGGEADGRRSNAPYNQGLQQNPTSRQHHATIDGERSALEALGMLTGAIAHEVNNILTPVLSYSQLALAKPHDADLCLRALQMAGNGAERASRLSDLILGLVRAESDATTDPHRCLEHLLDSVLVPRGVELVCDVPRGTLLQINPLGFEQVMLNLILNAAKAISPEAPSDLEDSEPAVKSGGVIAVLALPRHATSDHHSRSNQQSTPMAGGRCSPWNPPTDRDSRTIDRVCDELLGKSAQDGPPRIAVLDSGPGMSTHMAKRAFEPLITGAASPTSRSGTGLGLAICHHLIASASGTIELHTKPGVGTCFVLTIPQGNRSAQAA